MGKGTRRKHPDNKPRQAIGTRPDNKNRKEEHQHRHPTRSRTEQDADADKKPTQKNHADWKQAAYGPKADPRSKNPSGENKMPFEQEANNARAALKVTIQTTDGSYEESLAVDNSNNFPIQRRINIARCIISKPPRTMRNIHKYYTAKQLQTPQVLKFDIRNPDPSRQLRNRRGGGPRTCISRIPYRNTIEDTGKAKQASDQNVKKGQ